MRPAAAVSRVSAWRTSVPRAIVVTAIVGVALTACADNSSNRPQGPAGGTPASEQNPSASAAGSLPDPCSYLTTDEVRQDTGTDLSDGVASNAFSKIPALNNAICGWRGTNPPELGCHWL
jgi:hypothetical protein